MAWALWLFANHCTVVTDNERDFHEIAFINPVRGAP